MSIDPVPLSSGDPRVECLILHDSSGRGADDDLHRLEARRRAVAVARGTAPHTHTRAHVDGSGVLTDDTERNSR